jgi:archaemetzincin
MAESQRQEPDTGDVLLLVPIYMGEQADLLPALSSRLAQAFQLSVRVHPPQFDPELAFDASRGQYNSRLLLAQLLRDLRPGCARVLGVAGVDLFIPVLTFVFGEAQLDGQAAVVSTQRLGNELYGLRPDPRLTAERLLKEAVHELGHTYGLVHCHRPRCVMGSSTYVEEIDLKSERFCDGCLSQVRAVRVEPAPGGTGQSGEP